MCVVPRFVHFLIGIPADPRCRPLVPIPRLYDDPADAQKDLGVSIVLSRMTYGDALADSLSWYLQTAAVDDVSPAAGDVYYGYVFEDKVYPIAGGWTESEQFISTHWEPFVLEAERRHTERSRIPWRETTFERLQIDDIDSGRTVDFSCLRFAPWRSQLLVRPLDLFTTEPLF